MDPVSSSDTRCFIWTGHNLDLHGYLRRSGAGHYRLAGMYGIEGGRKPEYTGVWVGEEKIAAIGVKFNKAGLAAAS